MERTDPIEVNNTTLKLELSADDTKVDKMKKMQEVLSNYEDEKQQYSYETNFGMVDLQHQYRDLRTLLKHS